MKKALSVIMAIVLTSGIFTVGISAAGDGENRSVNNLSFKSGDVFDCNTLYNELHQYTLDFNADTDKPISAPITWEHDAYNDKYNGIKINSRLASYIRSVTFGGIGPVLVYNNKAFSGCNIRELYLPFNVYSYEYEDGEYDGASKRSYAAEEPLKSGYGQYMFSECRNLETVTIDNPSDTMLTYGFYSCTSLKTVSFTGKANLICTGMFENCTSLETVQISSSISKIRNCAFYNSGLKSIYIPSTVSTIEPYALGYLGNDLHGTGIETDFHSINNNPEKYEISKVEGFTIYGEAGSEAERYANENGFEFIETEEQTEKTVYSAYVAKQVDLGENAVITVSVSSGAEKVQLINSENKTITYTRNSVNVKSIETISDSKEIWTIYLKTYKLTETYNVKAKFGKMWVTGDNVQFILKNKEKEFKKAVLSARVTLQGIRGSYAHMIIISGGSPLKLQLRTGSGNTVTYTRDNINVEKIARSTTLEGENCESWYIKVKVSKPTENYTVAAKYSTGWSNETVSVTLNEEEGVKSSESIVIGQIKVGRTTKMTVTTAIGTQSMFFGNIFEGTFAHADGFADVPIGPDRASMTSPDDYYYIHTDNNGREFWELYNCVYFLNALPTDEIQYLSVKMADGSWAVAAFIISEANNQRNYKQVNIEELQKVNSAEVISQSGKYVDVKVNVTAGASKIQFINNKGETLTYTPLNTAVKSIEQSGDNEIWTISLYTYRPTDTYTVNAKYGREWKTGSGVQFTVNEQ